MKTTIIKSPCFFQFTTSKMISLFRIHNSFYLYTMFKYIMFPLYSYIQGRIVRATRKIRFIPPFFSSKRFRIFKTFFLLFKSRNLFIAFTSIATIVQMLFRSEEHTSELQSRFDIVCRLLLEKKKK